MERAFRAGSKGMRDGRSRAGSPGTLCRMYIYAVNVFMSFTFAFTVGEGWRRTKVSIIAYYVDDAFLPSFRETQEGCEDTLKEAQQAMPSE